MTDELQAVPWNLGTRPIPFWVGNNCARQIVERIAAIPADRLFVVADENAWRLHGQRYAPHWAATGRATVIPWGICEDQKTLTSVEDLCGKLIAGGATRQSLVVAMGGGAIGNAAGLAAGLLFRGVRLAHLPTTLLAMHDSVTSLKQGVNSGGIKNILGVYLPPEAIGVDTEFIATLPTSQIRSGLAELVKDALIFGGRQAEKIASAMEMNPADWAALVRLGVHCKAELMADDPHERGAAVALEYGHTVGHALELACRGELNHGDCVAWGMRCAAWIAGQMGLMREAAIGEHERWIARLGEIARPNYPIAAEDLWRRVKLDNKRGYLMQREHVAMVLLRAIGNLARTSSGLPLVLVPEDVVKAALDRLVRGWKI